MPVNILTCVQFPEHGPKRREANGTAVAVLRSQGSRGQTSLENGKWRRDGKSNHTVNSVMEKDLERIQEE